MARTPAALPGCAALALAGCGTADPVAAPVLDRTRGHHGPACDELPLGDAATGTAADPITAAGAEPDGPPATTARGLDASGLFAPADAARSALPASSLERWSARPDPDLRAVVARHAVVPRSAAAALSAGPDVRETPDRPLVVTGPPERLAVGRRQQVRVLCGDIRTAGTTVLVVDGALVPHGSSS